MNRSEQHIQGYRHAAKDAVEWLHERARSMNEGHAKALLNSAAYQLGIEHSRRGIIPTKRTKNTVPQTETQANTITSIPIDPATEPWSNE